METVPVKCHFCDKNILRITSKDGLIDVYETFTLSVVTTSGDRTFAHPIHSCLDDLQDNVVP